MSTPVAATMIDPSSSLLQEEEMVTSEAAYGQEDNGLPELPPLRERYLETFPFTESELDPILSAYRRQIVGIVGGDAVSELILALSDLREDGDSIKNNNCNIRYSEWVQQVETNILTRHISQLLVKVANDSVFLWSFQSEHDDELVRHEARMLEAVAALLGRRGPKCILQILFNTAAQLDKLKDDTSSQHFTSNDAASSTLAVVVAEDCQHNHADKVVESATPRTLAGLMYRCVIASLALQSHGKEGQEALLGQDFSNPPQAWVQSLTSKSKLGKVSCSDWMDFCILTAPQVPQILTSFCHFCLFALDTPFRGGSLFQLPQPHNQDEFSAIWKSNVVATGDDISITLGLLSLGGDWRRLYSTDLDGFHFSLLQQALLGYQGKTVILIRSTSDAVFGYYTETPWKISQKWYGGEGESFLFRLSPSLDLYGRTAAGDHASPKSSSQQYAMYLNPSPHRGEEALSGLAIGGVANEMPRLHLNKALEHCVACTTDSTYTPGPLLQDDESIFFDIDVLELWALDDEATFAAGRFCGSQQAAVHEARRIQCARIEDRAQFIPDLASDEYHNRRAKIFCHRDQVRGRHDFVVHEDRGQGYYMADHPPSPRKNDDDENCPI